MRHLNFIIGSVVLFLLVALRIVLFGLIKILGIPGKIYLLVMGFLLNRDNDLEKATWEVLRFINNEDYD